MKVVLLENCAQGKKGEVKEVSDGFARNFLIPKKLAKVVDAKISNEIKQQNNADKFHHEENLKAANELKKSLEQITVVQTIKFGENGKAFGSVSNKEIETALKEKGFEIDRKKIALDSLIKSEGTFIIKIKLYGGVEAKLKVVVEKE